MKSTDTWELEKDINKMKLKLFKSKRLYENFGQKEVFFLKEKYDYLTENWIADKINDFAHWASNLNDKDLIK